MHQQTKSASDSPASPHYQWARTLRISDDADCLVSGCLSMLKHWPQSDYMLVGRITRRPIKVAHITLPNGRQLRADVVTGSLYSKDGRCLTSTDLRLQPIRSGGKPRNKHQVRNEKWK